MSQPISVMVLVVATPIVLKMLAGKTKGELVERNPTIRIFGVALITQGLDLPTQKWHIHFAMAFALNVD